MARAETVCYFNGSAYIDMGKKFPLADSVSISAWVKVDPQFPSTNPPFNGAGIAGQGYWGSETGLGFLASGVDGAGNTSNDAISWQVRNGGTTASGAYSDTTLYTAGEWHHYLLVRDKGNGKARFYVDGALCGEEKDFSSSINLSPTKNFAIGKSMSGIGGCFKGWIADVALWDVALAAADAAMLPSVGANGISGKAPYAYFPLDEGSGNDVTGTDNGSPLTCTATNSLSWTDDTSFRRVSSDANGILSFSTFPDGIGSPSPSETASGLVAGSTVAVSCGVTPWTNAIETIVYSCTGWKLYDDGGNVVSNGTETSFIYTHPTPSSPRRLEWQWAVSEVKGTVSACGDGSVSPSGEAFYSAGIPATITATPDAGTPFVCWGGTSLPSGINVTLASVTFTPTAPFDMAAFFGSAFYVATNGDDGNSGTKAKPFATIGTAVMVAKKALAGGGLTSATVFVADGTYTLSGTITVDSPITIAGDSGNRDKAIVLASANNRAFELNHAAATLSGITVRNGNKGYGGNILIGASGGIVTNCVVANGRGGIGGNIAMGGTVNAAASSLVVDSVISNGTDTAGAGLWYAAGNIYMNGGRVLRCVISDGYVQAANGAGNVCLRSGSNKGATLENCLITGGSGGNTGASFASGVVLGDSRDRVVNCTVVGNRPPTGASKSAISLWNAAANAKVVNCVIYGNGDGGQDVSASCVAYFFNCAFSSDGANCADTVSPVTNLTDAAFKNYARGDYRPVAGGVLFNAGDTEAYTNYGAVSTTDLGGAARIGKNGIDIGCYEAAPNAGLQIYVR